MLNTANIYIDILNKLKEVGVDPDLVAEVEALNATVNGDETTDPPTIGLVDIVGDLSDDVEDLDIDINGDPTTSPATPGLKDRVVTLESTINGDPSATPAIPPLLAGAGNMRLSALWTNSAPTQSFAAQSITLSSGDYDLIVLVAGINGTYSCNTVFGIKGQNLRTITTNSQASSTAVRDLTYTTDTEYAVGNCTETGGSTSNNYLIPYIIYGIKIMSN